MQRRAATLLRYLASAAVAAVLVLGLSSAMLLYLDRPKPDPLPGMVREVQLTKSTDLNLDALLADQQGDRKPAPPKPVPKPGREIDGFVQVAYRVNPDGSVSDVKVLGSVPSGVYDEQAKAIVKQRMYAPDFDVNGKPHARQGTDVIKFTIPANRVSSHSD